MCRASRSSSGANAGNRDGQPHHQAPDARRRRDQPAEQQQQQRRHRHQAAPQIVENAPAVDQRQRIGLGSAAVGRHARQDPRRDLPVAANPAMLALAVTHVVERQVLEQLNIAGQRHARVRPFDQIVAEQRFRGKAVAERGAERLHVVNRLAVKDRFAEQILLRVGNGLAVGIGSGGVGENAREARRRGAGQSDADARLNDGEAALARARHGIDLHAVQRMRDGLHQPPRGGDRQLRVGIQRDHVADRERQACRQRDLARALRRTRSVFRSSILPRFRSRPIHRCSLSDQTRGRWNSRNRPPG